MVAENDSRHLILPPGRPIKKPVVPSHRLLHSRPTEGMERKTARIALLKRTIDAGFMKSFGATTYADREIAGKGFMFTLVRVL